MLLTARICDSGSDAAVFMRQCEMLARRKTSRRQMAEILRQSIPRKTVVLTIVVATVMLSAWQRHLCPLLFGNRGSIHPSRKHS